ncbi:MAG: ArsR/SmtB family transcription factor [Candidatus Odinarchaeota archaeon]
MNRLTQDEIKIIKKKFRNNKSYEFLRQYIEIIGNEDRFTILNLLSKKPCLLSDIENRLNRSQPTISHHIRILEKHKLVYSFKKGKFKKYSISRETFVKLLRSWNQWFYAIRSRND